MKNYKNIVNSVFGLFFITASFLFAESDAESSINSTNHFFSCIVYNDEWYYGGDLHIPVSSDLTNDKESIDEAVFAAALQLDLERSENLYNVLPDSRNGKILGTDIACHLHESYANSVDERHQYIYSTRMPAAWFVDYLYYKRLMELVAANRTGQMCFPSTNIVILAGGDGSGKTSSAQRLDLPVLKEAALIKDCTLGGDFDFQRDMVQKTIDSNLKLTIVYVYRPIELALEGIIKRAQLIGRARPLIEITKAHYRAQQNVLALHEYFGDKIEVIVIDNSRSFEEVHLVDDSISFIKSAEVYYESQDIVQERALIAYNNLDKAEVPEFIKNLLERKLDPTVFSDENYQSKSEKARWLNYLKNVISSISKKLGF